MNPAPPVTRTALGSPEVDNTARIMANRTQDPSPAVALDVTPLQNANRVRVIGWAGYRTYVRNLRRVDTYFAISKQTGRDLTDLLGVPSEKIVIAAPGINLPPPSGATFGGARPYFLYLGGPNPNKNLPTLLDAMARTATLPEELLIAGHWLPKQVAALNARVSASGLAGRVRHIGFVPDGELAVRLRDATAVVIPSRSEGFGLPVAEGLAAGPLVVPST